MSVVTKKTKVKQKYEKVYVPHQIRSHPFYFIGFPLLTVLITMFFWLILCPLVFAKCSTMAYSNRLWPVYFWVTAFIVYLIILALLICYWRCFGKKDKQLIYEITVEDKDQEENECSIELKDMPSKDVTDINANDSNIKKDTPDNNELFPRCSVRQKKRPQSLVLIEERPASQNLSSPLTPRELFFIDLIEGANKTCSSTTHTFLENEKQNYSPDPLVTSSDGDKAKCGSPSEFFIANVPVDQTCTSQVFLYVDEGNAKPQIEVICDTEGVIY